MKRSALSSASFGELPRLAALGVASLLLAMLGFKTISSFPSFFVEDDAWFYLQIGYNLTHLGQSTFEGIHTTSGYHLGWAGVLAAVSAFTSLFSPAKSLFLLVALGVYFLLGLVAVECFGRTVMEKAALLFFVFYPGLLMESQLLATLLLVVCHFFLAGKKSRLAYAAFALVPLVRIDATVMLVPLILWYLVPRDFDGFKKCSFFAGLGVAAHFGLMLLVFGRPASVSSLLKAYWSGQTTFVQIALTNFARYGRYELAVFAVMALLALAAGPWSLKILCVVAGPAAFVLIHVVANPVMRTWYFSPALFVLALVLIRTKARAVRAAFLVLVCALVVRETRNAYYFILDERATERAEKIALFLADVRRIVPEHEAIFQLDGCGYTGFFSGRPIVNGDGLVNSYAYFQRLKANELGDYLRENKIRYVITNSPLGDPYIIDYHGLVLTRDDARMVAEAGNREPFFALALWRIRDSYFTAAGGSRERAVGRRRMEVGGSGL